MDAFFDGKVVRLFPDYRPAEAAYFGQTGIFPIMHTIAIRRDIDERDRWIARNLFVALEEAKRRSVQRMMDITAAHVPLPWAAELAEVASGSVFGEGDFWPYGVASNRKTLEAFLRFAADQGTCHRHLALEEIFAEEALAEIRV